MFVLPKAMMCSPLAPFALVSPRPWLLAHCTTPNLEDQGNLFMLPSTRSIYAFTWLTRLDLPEIFCKILYLLLVSCLTKLTSQPGRPYLHGMGGVAIYKDCQLCTLHPSLQISVRFTSSLSFCQRYLHCRQ